MATVNAATTAPTDTASAAPANRKRTWEESFDALKLFKAKTGHCLVPIHNYAEDLALGGWVHHQRSKKHKLSDAQRQQLDDIGFAWSVRVRNKAWNQMTDKLKAYKGLHGDCDVPEVYQADQALADFVEEQRNKYQKGQLSGKRQKQLEDIGLVVNTNADADDESEEEAESGSDDDESTVASAATADLSVIEHDEVFEQNYKKLFAYHAQHGHCRNIKLQQSLGFWVSRLRKKYAADPDHGISIECQLMLDELEFDYQGPTLATPVPAKKKIKVMPPIIGNANGSDGEGTSDEDATESEGGSSDDGDDDNSVASEASSSSSSSSSSSESESDTDSDSEDSLNLTTSGISIKNGSKKRTNTTFNLLSGRGKLRRLRAGGSTTSLTSASKNGSAAADAKEAARIARNNSRDERFMKHYNALVTFKNKHGHTRVPQSAQYKTLGGWVNNLRVTYNRDPTEGIPANRIQLLNDIGFIWDASGGRPSNDMRWNEQYTSLLEFHKEYQHCRVPQTGKHRSLGRWVATQRAQYNKDPENGIRADRLKRLNDIGFTWNAKGFKGKHFYNKDDGSGGPKKRRKTSNTGDTEGNAGDDDTDSSATESDDDDDDDMSTASEGDDGGQFDDVEDDNLDFATENGATADPKTDYCQSGDGWDHYFNKLLEFYRKRGHVRLLGRPRYAKLLAWFDAQKQFYNKRDLATPLEGIQEVRRNRLRDIGCMWAASQEDNSKWYEEYSKLVAFQKQHNHCRVFSTDDNELALWTSAQQKNKINLSDKQVQSLDTIGLEWEDEHDKSLKASLNDAKWEELYQQLVEYHKKNGNCLVPQKGENKKLGKWVATQRLKHNNKDSKKRMRPDRFEKLNGMGFIWNAIEFRNRNHTNDTSEGGAEAKMNGKRGSANHMYAQHKIEPLVKKLIGLLEKDDSEAKSASVQSYRQKLQAMISETQVRLETSKPPPKKKSPAKRKPKRPAKEKAVAILDVEKWSAAIIKSADSMHVKVNVEPTSGDSLVSKPRAGQDPPFKNKCSKPDALEDAPAVVENPAEGEGITSAGASETEQPVRKVKMELPSKIDPPADGDNCGSADDGAERQARANEVHMQRLVSLEELKRQQAQEQEATG